MTFYLIDDDQDDQDFFQIALSDINADIKLRTANNGIAAIEELRQETFTPDFIFIDVNMPKMDGWECLTEVKKIPHLKKSKIIIYTTSEPYVTAARRGDLGITAFITKTATIASLSQIIQQLLDITSTATHANPNRQ